MLFTEKLQIANRFWLLGKNYHDTLAAMEFALKFHQGKRKDGFTPEFHHQLSIASYLRTMINHIEQPQNTLAVAYLHDVAEDYDVGFEEIESRFGVIIAKAVQCLTKKHRGQKIPLDVYYDGISKCKISSLVKGADRINNLQSMIGVFTREKQLEYIEETEKYILPMLKIARRTFTIQENVYFNIKLMLNSQIELLKAINYESGG